MTTDTITVAEPDPRDAGRHLDNKPNARKLLDSLRYLGYDNLHAISDIVDNAIDADAENIWVNIVREPGEELVIQVADDGNGMTAEILDQASRLGSDTARNPGTDLGRFGMGLVTAFLSLGRRLTIVTQSAGGELLTNITDVDHMAEQNEFVKEYFGPARPAEVELFENLVGHGRSGTVVQITKADGFKHKYVSSFEKILARHVGEVYRMFIRARRHFYVNDLEVPINDPLFIDDHPGAEIYSDETYELEYTGADGRSVTEPVRIRLVILPDHGGTQENRKKGYKVERSGFYVLRNNRQIADAQLLGLKSLSRHPDFIRFRGELFVTGRLDDAFGMEFTKRDVRPIQSVRDQLDDAIGASLRSIRGQLKKKEIKSQGADVDHSSAERLIDSKAALLIKPPARSVQERAELQGASGGDTPLGTVKFRVAQFGREGPIYATEQHGRTTLVDWNADHPFYERFILENRGDQGALNAIDAMIFSMAVAELKVFDEETITFIENWKAIFSSNLRTLLS